MVFKFIDVTDFLRQCTEDLRESEEHKDIVAEIKLTHSFLKEVAPKIITIYNQIDALREYVETNGHPARE